MNNETLEYIRRALADADKYRRPPVISADDLRALLKEYDRMEMHLTWFEDRGYETDIVELKDD